MTKKPLTDRLIFGFRHSFDIRHSCFVIHYARIISKFEHGFQPDLMHDNQIIHESRNLYAVRCCDD